MLREAERAGIGELPLVEISRKNRLLTALSLENRTGSYSWKEKLAIFDLADELTEDEDRDAVALAVCGNRGFFSTVRRFAALPGHLAAAVTEGKVDLAIAEKAVSLPAEACRMVFEAGKLSFSRVRRFLIYLAEIGKRDELSCGKLIELTGRLLQADDPDEAIEGVRNPQLTGLTKRFQDIEERYLKNTGVRLDAPAFFEGDAYTISFTFR